MKPTKEKLLQNRVAIDEIDAIILMTLLRESRTTFTSIAKACKISVAALRMRYKRLWKVGVVNGENMLVNPFSLGYRYVSVVGIITTKENEADATGVLKTLPYVSIVSGKFGKYNVFTVVALNNIEELSRIQRDLEANQIIKRADVLIWSETVTPEHPENLIIRPFSDRIEHEPVAIKKAEIKIDETDRKIARILTRKSRTSFRKIAEQLDISTKNVIERYKKLRGNVLTLSTITVDLSKLGFTAGAFLFIKLANRSKMSDVADELLKIPNLITLAKYIGAYDMFAHVVFEDFQGYFKMADSVGKIHDIDQIDIFLVPPHPVWPPNLFATLLDKPANS